MAVDNDIESRLTAFNEIRPEDFQGRSLITHDLIVAEEKVSGSLNNLGRLLYDFMDEENWAYPIWLNIFDKTGDLVQSQLGKLLTSEAAKNENVMNSLWWISRGLIPLKPDYKHGVAIEEANKYIFFNIFNRGFMKLDGKRISDYVELGKLVYEGQMDVECLDPFIVLGKFRKVK
jgi:hypothetical protein